MNDANLEKRVKRLELLHIWGVGAIVVIALGYVIYKRQKNKIKWQLEHNKYILQS